MTVATDPADYDMILAAMTAEGGATTLALRRALAAAAYARTAAYDAAIARWFAAQAEASSSPLVMVLAADAEAAQLRYGENPASARRRSMSRGNDRPSMYRHPRAESRRRGSCPCNNFNDADALVALALRVAERP